MGGVSSFQTKNIPYIIQKISIKHIKLMEEKYIPLSVKRESLHTRRREVSSPCGMGSAFSQVNRGV